MVSNMASIGAFILDTLTIGSVYALIAIGLSIIFGVLKVINFSHGELFALGAYLAYSVVATVGEGGFWVALVVVPIVVGVIGMGIERFGLRPIYDRNPLYHVLLTFGFVLIINDLISLLWGSTPKYFPAPPALAGTIPLFGTTYPLYNLFVIGMGIVLTAATWLLLQYTRFGLIVRAGSQDRSMVENLGIGIDRYYSLTFGFGAAMAALAGIALGGYQSVNLGMGNSIIITAFIIVVLGGLGSFRGAIVGAYAIGFVQIATRTFVPSLNAVAIYLVMIGVLLLKPQGLFGAAEHGSAGGLLTRRGGLGLLADRERELVGFGVVGLLLLLPLGVNLVVSESVLFLLTTVFVWALFAISIDLIMGYVGLVSLGHTLFYGLSAYTVVLALMHLTQSAIVAMALALVVVTAVGWVIGHLTIRISGIYFAMATLAFAQLFYNLVYQLDWTGGSDGLFGVDTFIGIAGIGFYPGDLSLALGPVQINDTVFFYYLILVSLVLGYVAARRITTSPFGSVLKAIRENEKRATLIGYDVVKHKRRAFTLSATLAGAAGGLFAIQSGYAAPSFLHWLQSGEVIIMAVLGGLGTLFGPVIGAAVFLGLENELTAYTSHWRLIVGALFVLVVLFTPRGLVSLPSTLVSTVGRIRQRVRTVVSR